MKKLFNLRLVGLAFGGNLEKFLDTLEITNVNNIEYGTVTLDKATGGKTSVEEAEIDIDILLDTSKVVALMRQLKELRCIAFKSLTGTVCPPEEAWAYILESVEECEEEDCDIEISDTIPEEDMDIPFIGIKIPECMTGLYKREEPTCKGLGELLEQRGISLDKVFDAGKHLNIGKIMVAPLVDKKEEPKETVKPDADKESENIIEKFTPEEFTNMVMSMVKKPDGLK